MKLLRTLLAIVAVHVLALGFIFGCSKPAPTVQPAIAGAAVRAELPGLLVSLDDASYSPLSHAWLESALERHLAATWHDRPYQPELKDCDDFTDFLVANVRHWFGETALVGSGGALIGRYTIFIAEADGGKGAWHRVAIARTERGWFVIDPQALVPSPWRMVPIPLANYGRPARLAAF